MAAFSLAVTVLDQEQAGLPSALLSRKGRGRCHEAVQGQGLPRRPDARRGVRLAAPERPDLELLGEQLPARPGPPAFDILYWNADPVRMTAAMHRDFMELAITNGLTEPGGATMLGSPIDLGKVDGRQLRRGRDRRPPCKWESCYRTTQLLGGDTRFVLSTSGHIAAMVNPPGNPKASYQTAPREPRRAPTGSSPRRKVKGSWWDDYVDVAGRAHRPGAEQAAQARARGLRAAVPGARGPMSMTAERERIRTVAVRGVQVRICERPARGSTPTSLRCCSATASGSASRCSSRSWTRCTRIAA